MPTEKKKKAGKIKASYRLQQKVGAGPLDLVAVRASQEVIDKNEVDFSPLGLAILGRLEEALRSAMQPGVSMKQAKHLMTTPVMEMKANAAIFHYTLIGNLANVMLSFLESIETLDEDAIRIVEAHHKTLHLIVVRKMKGDGGAAGEQLVSELKQACARYYNRRAADHNFPE